MPSDPIATRPELHTRVFTLLLLVIIGAAIVRSAITTRLDGFTYDEPWHIAAGVSYVRSNDFRLNPEHPPLVKLWVGHFLTDRHFHMDPVRTFAEKPDEREFVEQEVYLHNNPDLVQRRARLAMWLMNGALLGVLGFAVRRSFGPLVALGAVLFLAIDPTVAAHLPVVMTDLPIALLVASLVALSARAFLFWSWPDLAGCSILLGLALATKHSAPIFMVVVLTAGLIAALRFSSSPAVPSRARRVLRLLAMVTGALLILWWTYGFRYTESHGSDEAFNRPLTAKIADVQAPLYRATLQVLTHLHLAPRAYVWGFADTISAGLVGHATPVTAFGHAYWRTAPPYYFPGVLALKLPIGLSLLVLVSLTLLLTRRLLQRHTYGIVLIVAALAIFLVVLASGSSYAGVRHALPAIALLSLLAGFAVEAALLSRSLQLRGIVVICLVAAAVSAIPVMRPWEYFNEAIGGTRNGFLFFNDEGVDLGQRGKELAAYYHHVLEPAGERPSINYLSSPSEMRARGVRPSEEGATPANPGAPGSPNVVIMDARYLSPQPFWDSALLRAATPAARFGNLLIYRGPCPCGHLAAPGLFFTAIGMMYAEKPDLAAAEQLLKQAIAIDPKPYFVHLQLGNLYLRQGQRQKALQAYADAGHYATYDRPQQRLIAEQVARLNSNQPIERIQEMRNPAME